MPIATTCPKCQALFRLPDELAGRTVKCQKCAALFVAPSAGADTTMPGMPVELDAEPALEEAPVSAAGAAPLHGIGPPPLPTDSPKPTPWDDDPIEEGRDTDSPRKAPPATPKNADPVERAPRPRRTEKPKAGSSKLGLVLGIVGFLLLAFIVCAGATGIWYAVSNDRQKKLAPIAKKGAFKDVRKDELKFGGFDNPVANDGRILDRPPFDGFKDGKLPEPPPPGPPGSILVKFGPDGAYEDRNQLTLKDPLNKDGYRHKLYVVRLEAGYTYQFDMKSSDPDKLDPYLILRDDKGVFIAQNDDILQGRLRDSRLIYDATETGVFHLEATYWDPATAPNPPGQLIPPAGPYTLKVRHVK
jgi:predicted Zn finger-like uncharacterized protein